MFVASAVWRYRSARAAPVKAAAGRSLVNDGRSRRRHAAVGHVGGRDPDDELQLVCGVGTQRPNLVGDSERPADQRTPAQWFDTSPSRSRRSSRLAPRRAIRFAARRSERRLAVSAAACRCPAAGIELRVEAFNVLNTPPFGNPNSVLGAANFGTMTTAGDPRVIQLAVKLVF